MVPRGRGLIFNSISWLFVCPFWFSMKMQKSNLKPSPSALIIILCKGHHTYIYIYIHIIYILYVIYERLYGSYYTFTCILLVFKPICNVFKPYFGQFLISEFSSFQNYSENPPKSFENDPDAPHAVHPGSIPNIFLPKSVDFDLIIRMFTSPSRTISPALATILVGFASFHADSCHRFVVPLFLSPRYDHFRFMAFKLTVNLFGLLLAPPYKKATDFAVASWTMCARACLLACMCSAPLA